eukprot:TRINITY_DN16181_c0_g2_i1.p1 TRINITY_DN16181_c0_g2~~TRINITY_DN16181_c0_g2_i1.p1  ORF type:complete len:779 (+),score=131.36 TRINITY_DN16181_c0_g2_i1:53-2389(+)
MKVDGFSPVGLSSDGEDLPQPTVQSHAFCRLFLLWFASVLCSGISPGQSLWSELFSEAGLFTYVCSSNPSERKLAENVGYCDQQYLLVTNILGGMQGVVLIYLCISGMFFDIYGARTVAVFGAAILVVGVLIVAASLLVSCAELPMFIIGVALADMGSTMQNFGFYGLLFHLPGWQALVIALSNGCIQAAAVIPEVALRLRTHCGMSIVEVLLLFAVTIVIGGAITFCVVPSQSDFRLQAQDVLGLPLPVMKSSLVKVGETFRRAWRVLRVDMGQHLAVGFLIMLAFCTLFPYQALAVPFGAALFDDSDAGKRMGRIGVETNAFTGVVIVPLTGLFVDLIGTRALTFSIALSVCPVVAFCSMASWPLQWIASLASAFFTNAFLMFVVKYAVDIAPPDRIGTVQGLFVVLMFLSYFPMFIVMSLFFGQSDTIELDQICRATYMFGPVAIAGWLIYGLYTCRRPPRELSLHEEDEKDLMKRFGVASLAEAEEVLGIPRKEILRMLSSSNVLVQRDLLQLGLSPGVYERYRKLAHRRAQEVSPEEPIKDTEVLVELADGACIRKASGDDVVHPIVSSFLGGQGERGEPMFSFITQGLSSDKAALSLRSLLTVGAHVGARFGIALAVRDAQGAIEAVCVCFPPGSLIDGETSPQGSARWYYGFDKLSAEEAEFLMRAPDFRKRFIKFAQIDLAARHKALPPHWYVATLGVVPGHRGKGRGKALLDLVAKWARDDNVPCYLECGEVNVPIYQRCGYQVEWTDSVKTEQGEEMCAYGMLRPAGR